MPLIGPGVAFSEPQLCLSAGSVSGYNFRPRRGHRLGLFYGDPASLLSGARHAHHSQVALAHVNGRQYSLHSPSDKDTFAMKRALLMTCLLSCAVLPPIALAAKDKTEVIRPGQPLLAEVERIETDLNDGKTYSELKPDDRSRVREVLGRLRSASERFPDASAMPESARTQVFNDQQIVNTVLTQAREDSRLICRRERTVGSNRQQTSCMTVAERNRKREEGGNELQRVQRLGTRMDTTDF